MSKENLIPSDYAKLNTVIVKSPSFESRRVNLLLRSLDRTGFPTDILGAHAQQEYVEFKKILINSRIEVLEVHELIDDAVEVAKRAGIFDTFLEKNYPKLSAINSTKENDISAEDLVGAGQNTFYPRIVGKSPFLTQPLHWMYYTRDAAVALSDGIVLSAFDNRSRTPETPLIRFMFQNARRLKDHDIIFDAEAENTLVQGGDVIILNEKTLLMGVDNMSERMAAQKLAQRVGVDVIGVALPRGPADSRKNPMTAANILFLHLDTVFNLIDRNKALTIPYFFQDEYVGRNPLFGFLDSLELESLSDEDRKSIRDVRNALKDMGMVTVYKAESGKEQRLNVKLVDFLEKEFGYRFAFIGGEPKSSLNEQVIHLTENVLPELRFQAGNIVATEPGQIIMYSTDTDKTQESLRKLGVKVTTFDGHELARWNGGPHCMTLPLARG